MDIKLEPVDDDYITQGQTLRNELWYDVPIDTSDAQDQIEDVPQPIKSEIDFLQTNIKEEYDESLCQIKTEVHDDDAECCHFEIEETKEDPPIKLNDVTWTQSNDQVPHNSNAIKQEKYDVGECSYAERNPGQLVIPNNESSSMSQDPLLISTETSFPIQNSKEESNSDTPINCNKKSHEKTKKTKLSFKRFICDQCDFKSTHLSDLKTHKLSHTGEKPFKCTECDYRTVRSSRLKTHKMTHTGEKPMKCDQCSFSCARTSHLKIHKMLHSGEKPYKCDQCDYKSAQSFHLKTHKMSHTGEKPFKCDQCDYKSAISYTLKTHKLSHSGEKPFKCDQCDYKTTFSFSLKTHKMLHSGEKPFQCSVCEFKSARAYDLKRHQKSHSKLK